MPFEIERDGKNIKVWTEEEVEQEVKGLKVTNDNLKAEKKDLSDKLSEAKEFSRELEEAKAKAEGDNETLRRIAEEREAEKREAVEAERKRFADLLNTTKKEKVDNYLNDLVADLKPVDSIRAKQLKKLLKADYEFDFDLDKGEFKVSGNGVVNSDDLKRIVNESEEFRSFLAGSAASGGGAAGSKGSGVAKKFNEMTGSELVALRKEDPQAYDRIKAEFYGNR